MKVKYLTGSRPTFVADGRGVVIGAGAVIPSHVRLVLTVGVVVTRWTRTYHVYTDTGRRTNRHTLRHAHT